MWWSFTFTRPKEVLLWLWVVKRAPCMPVEFCKDLILHVARKYLAYTIQVDMTRRHTVKRTLFVESDMLEEQNAVIHSWVTRSKTVATWGRRDGKSTLIAELANQIPEPFSVCILVANELTSLLMSAKLKNSKNIRVTTAEIYAKSKIRLYDFIFSDNVDVDSSLVRYNARYLALFSSNP